ncbi:MAG: response regulator [Candidatus Levyibacteriota bacterium]
MRDKKNIIIIDDDEAIGQSLYEILKDMYTVSVFSKGAAAMENLFEQNPDGVLLDYFLPGENTEEIIQALRNFSDNIPIIVMSANLGLIEHKDNLRVQDFLEKPFQIDKIMHTLSKHIS